MQSTRNGAPYPLFLAQAGHGQHFLVKLYHKILFFGSR